MSIKEPKTNKPNREEVRQIDECESKRDKEKTLEKNLEM